MGLEEIAAAVEAGVEQEKHLDWEGALSVYRDGLARLATVPEDPELLALRSYARLREANALMELGREEARGSFDAGIDDAKRSGDTLTLGRALIGAGVFAARTGDRERGEGFLLAAVESLQDRGGPEERQALGWALLNLGGLYGKMGRLDLAFLTLHQAREALFALSNWVGVAAAWETEAKLREALGDAERAREDYAEALVLYRKEGMEEKAAELQAKVGRKVV